MSCNLAKTWPAIRVAWIERRAARAGTIGRAEIIETLGVHASQASNDIQALLKIHPGCLTYDLSAKVYRWSGGKPVSPTPALFVEFDGQEGNSDAKE